MFFKSLGNKLTVGVFSVITSESMKANSMEGQIAQANAEMQTSWKDPPKTSEQPKKKSKLLLIAIIVAPVIWGALGFLSLIGYIRGNKVVDWGKEILAFVLVLLYIAIPTLLIVIGQRKDNRKMILVAGIVYSLFVIICTPSAVLCFIAYAKMKKQE